MKMTLPLTASAALLTAMVAASIWGWWLRGSEVELTVHFLLDGTPNRYAPAPFAFSIVPLAAAFATLLFAVTPRFDPKASASPRLYKGLWLLVLLTLAAGHALIVWHALTTVR